MLLEIYVFSRSYTVNFGRVRTPRQVVIVLNSAKVPLRPFAMRELDNEEVGWQTRMRDKIDSARTPQDWVELIRPVVNGHVTYIDAVQALAGGAQQLDGNPAFV